jgi:hypothetical protein
MDSYLGDISPLLSFQEPIGPINEDIVSQGETETNETMINRINKNVNLNDASTNKMPIEEFKT